MPTWARKATIRLLLVAVAVAAAHAVAVAIPLQLTAIGGLAGVHYRVTSADASYEPTEDVVFDFNSPVNPQSVQSSLTVTPAAPFRVHLESYGKRAVITMRKVPGTIYRLQLAAGVAAIDGSLSPQPIDLTVRTDDVHVPAPERAAPGEPYRYGVLAHPYPFSLGGPSAAHMIDMMATAGVRFVRIDYCGDQIEHERDRFDFSIEDRIADALAARGITELPILDQYCAPAWGNGGFPYPAIWENPEAYGRFAGAVAAHVAARYPHITRVELFNEPNLIGWWVNRADPAYADPDGSAAAAYMHAAYAAIKSASARLTVVGPALGSGGHEVDPRAFFERLYTDGCRRGVCWDVLSIHNYRWVNPTFAVPESAPNRFNIYRAIQEIAAEHGDSGTHVMLTEWGYSTIDSPDGVDPKTQAAYVGLGFNLMLADPTVDGIVYVNLQNPATDFWGQTALVEPDFTPKPAYDVYRAFARDAR
jgi:hypothetical protein